MFDTIRRVKELARAHGMSPTELCRRSCLSMNTLSAAKSRCGMLRLDTIERICETLGITLSAFFDETQGGKGENAAETEAPA